MKTVSKLITHVASGDYILFPKSQKIRRLRDVEYKYGDFVATFYCGKIKVYQKDEYLSQVLFYDRRAQR